jgi:hypothetical protein
MKNVVASSLSTCCGIEVENTVHLFFSWIKSRLVLNMIWSWMDVQEPPPLTYILQSFNHFKGLFTSSKKQRAGMAIWVATLSSIWLHRNEILFQENNVQHDQVLDAIRVRWWQWLRGKGIAVGAFSSCIISPRVCIGGGQGW